MQEARLRQALAKCGQVHVAESLVGREGQFERRAFQMIDQNFEVVRLHVGMFRRPSEKIIGMLDDELVEGRRGCDHHGARSAAAAPGTAGTLPRGGNGAGVSGHDTGIKRADIYAQFEGVGRDYAANAAVAQSTLDFTPLSRQISPAIAANRLGLAGLWSIGLLQISEQELGVQAAIGKHNGLKFSQGSSLATRVDSVK